MELVVMVVVGGGSNSSSLDVGRGACGAVGYIRRRQIKRNLQKVHIMVLSARISPTESVSSCPPRVDVDYICTMLLHQIIHEKL